MPENSYMSTVCSFTVLVYNKICRILLFVGLKTFFLQNLDSILLNFLSIISILISFLIHRLILKILNNFIGVIFLFKC